MARNCAVIVGINDYDEISPLKYAKSDAERMRDFFMRDLGVGHDDLYFFTDDSPRNAQGRKTQPTYGTLKSFLGDRFENSFLSAGDTLWFYFSGHGMPCEGRDYLLPSDGNPRSIPDLAIAIGYVTERLRRSGADNVVMLIDACRSDGAKNAGMGIGEEKQQGVITFFSCSPSQVSYEIDEIGQGAFTNVLLEALRIQGEGNCATVERFYQFLRTQVPRLTQLHKNYFQTPYAIIEPATKLHYILLPKFANLTDITALKNDALKAEISGNIELAEQIWKRVNAASSGTDSDVFDAFMRLANRQSKANPQATVTISDRGSKSPSAPTVAEVKKNPVELVSAKGIDYRELEKLLKNKQWYEADQLTDKLMLDASELWKVGWIDLESIKKFSCEDLQTIDRLWVHYSNGLYGFSVQKDIYVECGGKLNFSHSSNETWAKFCDRTAWKSKGNFVNYPDQFFQDKFMAMKGHLPSVWGEDRLYFFSRIASCEMSDKAWGKPPSVPTVSPPPVPKEFQKEVIGRKMPLVPEVTKNPVELLSAKGIDYRELEKLLKAKEWRSADELTATLMLKIANCESQGRLDENSIKIFPCEDLRTIDQLWVHYSNSKFGFSIQKKLWLECDGELGGELDYWVWKNFTAKVGWYHPQKDDWRTCTEFMNDTENARNSLPASLPLKVFCYRDERRHKILFSGLGMCVSSLAQRLVDCSR